MEFKKINEDKFQCLLYEEDLEYNNITLDDFFRNDTEKIHNLLEVIMDEAHKNIGVELGGGVMSLQLAPQPDHSILLTVSSGKEDFGNMLKQAGERAAKALGDRSKSESNVIKNGGEDLKAPEFAAFDKLKDIFDQMKDIPEAEKFIKEAKKAKDNKPKVSDVVTVGYGVYILEVYLAIAIIYWLLSLLLAKLVDSGEKALGRHQGIAPVRKRAASGKER